MKTAYRSFHISTQPGITQLTRLAPACYMIMFAWIAAAAEPTSGRFK